MRLLPVAAAIMSSTAFLQGAFAAEPAYLDDRSNAAAIVRSLYNAISRHEYSRAWDYFGDKKPAKDFQAFVKGYEGTDRVDVVTGDVSEEGAAGSTFFNVPVAIVAFNKDGSEAVFAGCYAARLADPAIREPPFTPLHIESGSLKPSEQPFEEKLPAQCGDAPPVRKDAVLDQARAIFALAHAGQCDAIKPGVEPDAPESYTIPYHYSTSGVDEPEQQARLLRFYCGTGAYNESHIYYLYKELEGLRELQFAAPQLDIRYVNDDHEGKVESITVIGFTTDVEMVNSFYDEATKSISAHPKWRGVGDASSDGTWIFRDGDFALVNYAVDASYDGEINPETVLDYSTGP